jgi:hypothetical protein
MKYLNYVAEKVYQSYEEAGHDKAYLYEKRNKLLKMDVYESIRSIRSLDYPTQALVAKKFNVPADHLRFVIDFIVEKL